jgi:uncharacterized protein GlcG (DUF336 family)
MIDAAVASAQELQQHVAVAVVNEWGHVVSLDKMDGAALHRDRFAVAKAFTTLLLQVPTSDAARLRESAPDRYNTTPSLFPGEVYYVGGGVPLEVDGRVGGAIGVAGARGVGLDEKIAEAGIAAWRSQAS